MVLTLSRGVRLWTEQLSTGLEPGVHRGAITTADILHTRHHSNRGTLIIQQITTTTIWARSSARATITFIIRKSEYLSLILSIIYYMYNYLKSTISHIQYELARDSIFICFLRRLGKFSSFKILYLISESVTLLESWKWGVWAFTN